MVNEAAFFVLCEGTNPATGRKLGQRMNPVRQDAGKDAVANRRIISDFAIALSKWVSDIAPYRDDPISSLHNEAIRQTLLALEKFADNRRLADENAYPARPTPWIFCRKEAQNAQRRWGCPPRQAIVN
jgi:hypothetical protein